MRNFENFQSSYFSEHFSTTTFEKTEIQLEKYTNRKALKFVPTCPLFSRAYEPTSLRAYVYIYIFFSCLRAFVSYDSCLHVLSTYLVSSINYSLPKCAHFSWSYVPTITQDLKTDIYPADEN